MLYFILGCSFGLICWMASDNLYKDNLVLKANPKFRTSEKIRGGYYYIVPENEYIEMEKYSLFWQYQNLDRKDN